MWYLNGTINGLLTLIPIVVGINRIVLSQELGSLDELLIAQRALLPSGNRSRILSVLP